MSVKDQRELELLLRLEQAVRSMEPGRKSSTLNRMRSTGVLEALEALKTHRTLMDRKASTLDSRKCVCGHARGDHRPFTAKNHNTECLDDDCACLGFRYKNATAFRNQAN